MSELIIGVNDSLLIDETNIMYIHNAIWLSELYSLMT